MCLSAAGASTSYMPAAAGSFSTALAATTTPTVMPPAVHRLGQPPRLPADEQPHGQGGRQQEQAAERRNRGPTAAPEAGACWPARCRLGPARGGPGQQAEPGQQDDLDEGDDAAQQVGGDADPRFQVVFDVDRCRAALGAGPLAGPAAAASPSIVSPGRLPAQGARPARQSRGAIGLARRSPRRAPARGSALAPGTPRRSFATVRAARPDISAGPVTGSPPGSPRTPAGPRASPADELLVERGGVGMGLAVGGDVRHRVQAPAPRLPDPGRLPGGVLGAHQGSPELLGAAVAGQPGPGRAGRGGRVAGRELELGQQLGRIHDLSAHGLGEGQVQPPVVAAGERLAADQRQRVAQAAAVADVQALVRSAPRSRTSPTCVRVQRVLAAPRCSIHSRPRRPGRAGGGSAR